MADLIDREVAIGLCEPSRSAGPSERATMRVIAGGLRAIPTAPDPRDEVIRGLVEALEGIEIYGRDTLSGRTDGPDDRKWHREGVFEMTNRAAAALAAARKLGVE